MEIAIYIKMIVVISGLGKFDFTIVRQKCLTALQWFYDISSLLLRASICFFKLQEQNRIQNRSIIADGLRQRLKIDT